MASEHLIPTLNHRGFKRMPIITGNRPRETVEIYESSAADEPCIWVMTSAPENRTRPFAGPKNGTPAHFTLEGAAMLRDQLEWLIENHYQKVQVQACNDCTCCTDDDCFSGAGGCSVPGCPCTTTT